MEDHDQTERLLSNLHNIEINQQYDTDIKTLDDAVRHSWNKRACSQQYDTSEIQMDNYYVCTNNKPCTYKKYENKVNKCTYLDQSNKDLMDFYNSK